MLNKFDNTVVLVATHKPDKVYQDDIYTPIHVGRAVSKFKEEMTEIIGDDTGDNISAKNPRYCELTAIYWAWKNMNNTNYVGLCHYRRYFKTLYTSDKINFVLKEYDVVLPSPIYYPFTMEDKLYRAVCEEDVAIFYQVIDKLYPEYKKSVLKYMHGNKDIAFNMFICSKEIFDKYCEWLFHILFECEKYIRLSGYSRAQRIFGHLSEYLLPIYCIHNQLRIKYEPLITFIGDKKPLYHQSIVKKGILFFQYKLCNWRLKADWNISQVILNGLKQDNIQIK